MSMDIKIGKRYKTRDGDIARITSIKRYSESDPFTVNGFIGETEMNWTPEGAYYTDEESMYDLVSEHVEVPAPFVMDARATMAMHFMSAMIGYPDKEHTKRGACGVPILAGYAVEYADALIAELEKGKTE